MAETNAALTTLSSAISSGNVQQVLSQLDASTRLQLTDLDLSSPKAQQVALALANARVTQELKSMIFYKATLGPDEISFYMIREEGKWKLCGF